MTKEDEENKNKGKINDSIFSKINQLIKNEKEDFDDKYIIDVKSEDVVDRITISKKAISEDTQKARDFLKNLSSQKDLGSIENPNQSKKQGSFAKKILDERNVKFKDSKGQGR